MKKLMTVLAAAMTAAVTQMAVAADWFNIYSDEMKTDDTPIWAAADQTLESPVDCVSWAQMSSGNDYWILGNGFKAGNYKAAGTLKNKVTGNKTFPSGMTFNVGSPSTSRFGASTGKYRHIAGDKCTLKGVIRWYDGTIENSQTYSNPRVLALDDSLVVEQIDSGCVHILNQNSSSGKENRYPILVSAPISGTSADAVISCQSPVAGTDAQILAEQGYFEFTGNNGGYNGSFSLESVGHPFMIGGTQTLGNPEVPNAAALTVCDGGVIAVGSDSSAATRGIRLDGDTAYLVAWETAYSGFSLGYPVSRNSDVAGKLVKIGPGTVTMNADYEAGDVEVAAGTLVIGANAMLSEGQRIVVKDGAVLKCVYNPNIDYTHVTITTEGTGTVTYDDGYRLNNGVWEASVTMGVEGDGTVDATAWERIGAIVTRTADAGSDSFIRWAGDLAALIDRDPFASSVRVRVSGPLALTALFGTLVPPENVTCPDGSTFVFADRTMTVTVPTDVVSTYDYSAKLSSGYVTNVVKKGVGGLTLASVPGYIGNFSVSTGYVRLADEGAFGADGCGTVSVESGAAIWINTANVVARGKVVRLSGSGIGSDTAKKGVLRAELANSSGIIGRFELVDDVEIYLAKDSKIFSGSTVNMNGKTLNVSSYQYGTLALTGVVFANGSNVDATLNFSGKNTRVQLAECSFEGVGQLSVANGCRCQVTGINAGSWPIVPGYVVYMFGVKNSDPENLSYRWTGGATVASGCNLHFNTSEVVTDSVFCFDGPLLGEGSCYLDGGVLHWFSSESDFAGEFKISADALGKNTLRTTLYLHNGSALNVERITIEEATLRLDDSTAFKLPEVLCKTGNCSIVGGPVGGASCGRAVLAAISQSVADDAGVFLVDSPVVVTGLTSIARGTLKLGMCEQPSLRLTQDQLPVFSNLVFAVETSFDLAGNDLKIPSFAGCPTILNAGIVTIENAFILSAEDLAAGQVIDFGDGALTFASGAKIVIDDSSVRPRSNVPYVIALASGGVTGTPVVETVRGRKGWTAKVDATGTKLVVQRNAGTILVVR